jgi:hypothetical protein
MLDFQVVAESPNLVLNLVQQKLEPPRGGTALSCPTAVNLESESLSGCPGLEVSRIACAWHGVLKIPSAKVLLRQGLVSSGDCYVKVKMGTR